MQCVHFGCNFSLDCVSEGAGTIHFRLQKKKKGVSYLLFTDCVGGWVGGEGEKKREVATKKLII